MNRRLIIELPTSLSASIIGEWLSVKDLVRLDSAHCQAFVRDTFLQLTRSPELSVKSWVQDHNRALVTWALMREVYVEKLSVETKGNLDLYNAYLQRFGNRVSVLWLNGIKLASLAHSVATCRNLLVLRVHIGKLSASLRDVFMFCKRLREFRFRSIFHYFNADPSDPPLTSAHLESIACTSLTYLELDYCDVNLVAAFLRMAVAVEAVVLSPKDEHLDQVYSSLSPTTNTLSLRNITAKKNFANVATRCLSIANMTFPQCYVTDSAITTFGKFTNLRALDLTYAIFETMDSLSVLASSCGDKLTELLLYACHPTLPLVTVQKVLSLFTKLKSFSFCFEDDNTAVWDMSSCSRLTKLSLSYYGNSDAELVSQLTEHCYVNLRELNLTAVLSEVVNDELDVLVSTCTNLCVLHLRNNCNNQNKAKYWCTSEDEERWQNLRPGLTVCGG